MPKIANPRKLPFPHLSFIESKTNTPGTRIVQICESASKSRLLCCHRFISQPSSYRINLRPKLQRRQPINSVIRLSLLFPLRVLFLLIHFQSPFPVSLPRITRDPYRRSLFFIASRYQRGFLAAKGKALTSFACVCLLYRLYPEAISKLFARVRISLNWTSSLRLALQSHRRCARG